MTPAFILFLFSSLVKPPKRAKSVRSHWEGQELTQTGHTAAHRRSRWSLQLLEGLGDPLPLCSQFYPLQLSGVGFGDHILNWPEGEQKISAVPTTGFGGDLGRLGGDKCGATSFLRNSDKIYEKKRNASQAPGRRFWPSAAARTRTRSWRPLWTRWWPPGSLIVRSVGWRWTTRPTPCDCYCSKWGGM